MGLQIRTYVNGEQKYIDLYGDEEIRIDVSFAEIEDITKRNSAYTQEFKVPGTNNNNEIFNYFFEVNSVPLDWNPKKKFEASLIYNGYEIFNGNIRLNQVSIVIKEKIYSITFYAQVGDLASNIGDKAMCNIDTSSLNHSLYDDSVTDYLFSDPSLHPVDYISTHASSSYLNFLNNNIPTWNNVVTQGKVQYTLAQRGYDYTGNTFGTIRDIDTNQTPILDFSGVTGYFDNQFTPLISSYLIPSVRTRDLYTLICNQADYQIESYFFDSDYFGRYYVPLSFNTESPYMAQAREYKYEFYNTSGTTGGTSGFTVVNLSPGGSTNVEDVFKTKVIVEENLGFNPVQPSEFSFAPTLSAKTEYFFALPIAPVEPYNIQIQSLSEYVGPGDPMGFPQIAGHINVYRLSTLPTTVNQLKGYEEASYSFILDNAIPNNSSLDIYNFTLQPYSNISGKTFYFVSVLFDIPDCQINSLDLKITSSPIVTPYTIELNKEMDCTKKQIEFIQDVNRMFNLVVVPHPIRPKTLIVEPLVDWIGKGEQLDWTNKVNYNDPQILRPTTSIINGSIFASNKKDNDFINTQFNNRSNKVFGQQIIDLGVDYKNAYTPLTQNLGQNTDYYLNASGTTNIALPCYFISKEGNTNGIPIFEYRPFRSLPRMTFKSVPIPSGNTGQPHIYLRTAGTNSPFTVVGFQSWGDIPNTNRLTTYPYAVSGFSHYTTYDASTKFTPDELVYPEVETQYDRYYRDYVEDLISEENKIYNIRMYLTPWEVSGLYFNEVIFIKNAKYRINKITNLNLIEPDLCDVELVKLTRNYTPTPTLFFDLIKCDNSCEVIHSHTDLNYLLWAFKDQVVELTTYWDTTGFTKETYYVIQTDYNSDYTYENVYFSYDKILDGVNPNDYYVDWNFKTFSGCSATLPNRTLEVYNNTTALTTNECVKMVCTNLDGGLGQSFTFLDCSGVENMIFVGPGSSTSVCGYYGSFVGTSFSFCVDLNPLVPC
jgi:hypothetical protein